MKMATIYQRNKDIFVHAQARTTAGVWIISEPVTKLDADCPDDALGSVLRAALQDSRSEIRHPAVWTGLLDPLLRLAEMKSWGAFSKGTRSVGIEQDAGKITFVPTRNLGAKEGFTDEPEAAVVVGDGVSAVALGRAARDALARAS